MSSARPIPLSVIGGFLGSGKTTLVNRLLKGEHGRRLAVVVNDFGAVDIDSKLIVRHDGQTIALSNGCICCSISSNLTSTLLALRRDSHPPDHVVIETSGVSDPWKIAQIGLAGRAFSLLGITIVTDAAEVHRQAHDAHMGETVRRQLRCADLLVLNKCDLASPRTLSGLRRWLAAEASRARMIETRFGAVGHALILDPAVGGAPSPDGYKVESTDSMHMEGLGCWTVELSQPIERGPLEAALNEAPDGLLRAKGFIPLRDGGLHVMQMVGRRWSLTSAPDETAARAVAVVVAIGRGDARTARLVEAWLARLEQPASCRTQVALGF